MAVAGENRLGEFGYHTLHTMTETLFGMIVVHYGCGFGIVVLLNSFENVGLTGKGKSLIAKKGPVQVIFVRRHGLGFGRRRRVRFCAE